MMEKKINKVAAFSGETAFHCHMLSKLAAELS